ncbi:Yip1 family protein [Anianabacter salinae]|uniref:Yip1 family protein n=1 Tax=Anianabacter salinae TaxID=2851023 RepID=UPI00225E0B09|nr:Yip1 family protein [Anianabacter salinae]MBV0912230.1 YIP1 family protein [Anianabacter salinae]
MTFGDILRLGVSSIPNPQQGLRAVFSLGLGRAEAWQALILMVVVSTLLGEATAALLPVSASIAGPLLATPLLAFVVQLCLLVVAVFAIFWIGRAMGGTGAFEDAVLTVAWLQFILVMLQLAQIAALVVFPPVAAWLGILGIGLFFWLVTHFTAALHGFTQPGKVFLMVVVSMLGIAFGLSIILSLIGVSAPGA